MQSRDRDEERLNDSQGSKRKARDRGFTEDERLTALQRDMEKERLTQRQRGDKEEKRLTYSREDTEDKRLT